MMKEGNEIMRKLIGVAMLFVTAATIFMVKGYMDQVSVQSQMRSQGTTQAVQELDSPSQDNAFGGEDAGGVREWTAADYAAVQAYVSVYAKEWNVQKYYDGESWKIYELGKRLAIVAYNYLNDYSYDTGGYSRDIGRIPIYEYKILTDLGEIVTERAEGYRPTTKGEVLEKKVVGSRPAIHEEVPLEHHEYHGTDIEYTTPAITISDETVDMSEMGGPVFDLVMFRVDTVDGKEYLINDDFKFALYYDGTFLEYCEPDAYGHYQGYYAFT